MSTPQHSAYSIVSEVAQPSQSSQYPASTATLAPVAPEANNRITRRTDGCLTCRIRRKPCPTRCTDGAPPTEPCSACIRLKIQCLGFAKERPDWAKEPNVGPMRNALKDHTSKRRLNPNIPTLNLAPFYEGTEFDAPFPITGDSTFPLLPSPSTTNLDVDTNTVDDSSSLSPEPSGRATPNILSPIDESTLSTATGIHHLPWEPAPGTELQANMVAGPNHVPIGYPSTLNNPQAFSVPSSAYGYFGEPNAQHQAVQPSADPNILSEMFAADSPLFDSVLQNPDRDLPNGILPSSFTNNEDSQAPQ